VAVDVQHEETWPEVLSLEALKAHRDGALASLVLLKQPRLSVQPVSRDDFDFVLALRDDHEAGAGKRRRGD